ncbi:MAG: UDP-N-acetylglucosamine 2-epimerase (non-hydrolyzing) [Gemmatimonadota bacterium]
MTTILHVVGARPNFMKIAPLLRAAGEVPGWRNLLVHTGQHYDEGMSDAFFRDLDIPHPDIHLGVGSGSHGAQTARVLEGMEEVLLEHGPDLVVVVGDVNSTLASALAAAKLHIPVAHVEAGLRSGDRHMPEELNRILTDQLSDLCLTPSRDAEPHLRGEGITPERIHFVGNIMIDSLLHAMERARGLGLRSELGLEEGGYLLSTLHRPSNVDDPEQLEEILSAFRELAESHPLLLPLHPRTRGRIEEFGLETGGIRTMEPVGYLEILHLQEGAALVLTDSGGIQEETTVLGVPCLTLRSTTERPITISEGTNTLVPVRSREAILAAAAGALEREHRGQRPEGWDGRTAERIVEVVRAFLERD